MEERMNDPLVEVTVKIFKAVVPINVQEFGLCTHTPPSTHLPIPSTHVDTSRSKPIPSQPVQK